jgi:hypothetical protein
MVRTGILKLIRTKASLGQVSIMFQNKRCGAGQNWVQEPATGVGACYNRWVGSCLIWG